MDAWNALVIFLNVVISIIWIGLAYCSDIWYILVLSVPIIFCIFAIRYGNKKHNTKYEKNVSITILALSILFAIMSAGIFFLKECYQYIWYKVEYRQRRWGKYKGYQKVQTDEPSTEQPEIELQAVGAG